MLDRLRRAGRAAMNGVRGLFGRRQAGAAPNAGSPDQSSAY